MRPWGDVLFERRRIPDVDPTFSHYTTKEATIGFNGQSRIAVAADATGVYSISADSRDEDATNSMGDHTVHVDR